MVAGVSDDVQLHKEKLLELQSDPSPFQFLGILGIMDGSQGSITLHQVEWGGNEIWDGLR